MGDRHLSCMLSGLPIVENTPVRAFILVQPKNNYLQNSLFSMPHESTSLFLPIAPGIQGIWKENEAGNLAFAKAKPSECVSTGIVHFFGANADNPAKLVNMIIDTTREGKCRNVLFGSFRKEKVRTTLAFVREDAYAAFMKAAEIDPIDQDKVLKDLQAIKKARAESWRRNKKFVEHLSTATTASKRHAHSPYLVGQSYMMDSQSMSRLPITFPLRTCPSVDTLIPTRSERMGRPSLSSSALSRAG